MRKSLFVSALVFGSFLSTAAVAAAPAGTSHAASAVRVERDSPREERWELRDLEALQDRLARARRTFDRRALRAVDADLERAVASELRETRSEVGEARADAWHGGRRGAGQRRAEVREESRELTRLRAIADGLRPLYGRYDRASLARKAGLLSELVELARRDVRDAQRDTRVSRR